MVWERNREPDGGRDREPDSGRDREPDSERDREPDSERDQEPLAAEARTITASSAPKEEDCDAGDLALECSRASLLVQEQDQKLDGGQN